MKIAIHFEAEKRNFCHGWIEACEYYGVEYSLINCFDSDIINKIRDIDYLMWHWYQSNFQANLLATPLLLSLELGGIKAYPNSKMALFFDNKLAQKYLFDSLNLNRINTYTFYDKQQANDWANTVHLPVVHKLKGGAGSVNVSLIKSRRKLKKLINCAFSRGLNNVNYLNVISDRLKRYRKSPSISGLVSIAGGIWYFLTSSIRTNNKEKGYVYFQDFHNNSFDIRIIVIGKRAIGIKRLNRKNSFKASGSGKIVFDHNQIPIDCVKMSFDAAKIIQTNIVAFDFLSVNGCWSFVEMSYGFASKYYQQCEGYWDTNLQWFDEQIIPERMMVKSLIDKINEEINSK